MIDSTGNLFVFLLGTAFFLHCKPTVKYIKDIFQVQIMSSDYQLKNRKNI